MIVWHDHLTVDRRKSHTDHLRGVRGLCGGLQSCLRKRMGAGATITGADFGDLTHLQNALVVVAALPLCAALPI